MDENSSKAGEVLLRLSDIMKYQLYECNQETVSLSREINNIANYVELEKMRIEEAVRGRIHFFYKKQWAANCTFHAASVY